MLWWRLTSLWPPQESAHRNRILALIFCILTFPVIIFTFYDVSSSGIWFYSFQYLTEQGNIIFWTFLLLYALLSNRRIFNGNYFLICALAYITFVFLGFNILLLPSMVENAAYVQPKDWVSTVWYHMFSPILDITFGSIILAKIKNPMPSYKVVGYGMIYIAYQFAYFCILPFASWAIRLNNKKVNYDYLNLSMNSNVVGSCSYRLPFNNNNTGGKTILGVANNILNNFSGQQRIKLEQGMITHWFTVNGTSFVEYKNGNLIVSKIPNTTQLASIYNNMGLSYDAIKNINANGLHYFHDNVFSVYGIITNLNHNVDIFGINSFSGKSLDSLYSNLTGNNFNSTENNFYVSHPGSYIIFAVIFGAILAYFIFLTFWWGMARIGAKRRNKIR